jgi:hypothetical protein
MEMEFDVMALQMLDGEEATAGDAGFRPCTFTCGITNWSTGG